MEHTSIKALYLEEFDREMATTRKILERVPFGEKAEWQPHERSMPLGRLAVHIARLTEMPVNIIGTGSFTFGASGSASPAAKIADTAGLMAAFDEAAAKARAALAGTDDAHFAGEWELTFENGTTRHQIFKGTRAMAYRSLFMNHLIHHRAQLGVYLRLNGIAIPGSYGPSADEPIA